MKCAILLKLCILSLFGWGIYYSRFHTFRETHVSTDVVFRGGTDGIDFTEREQGDLHKQQFGGV